METSSNSVQSEMNTVNTSLETDSSDDDDFKLPYVKKSNHVPRSGNDPSTSASETIMKYSCNRCTYKSNKSFNLKKHMQTHDKVPKRKDNSYTCIPCKYSTTKVSSWTKHQKTKQHQQLSVNDQSIEGKLIRCTEQQCSFSGSRIEGLRLHLEKEHSKTFEKEELSFENFEAFKVWKNELQDRDFIKFIKQRGAKTSSTVYYCHRSRSYASKGQGLRELKKRGSVKCGTTCLARIVLKSIESGCSVDYWKTHVGHLIETGKVGITSPQKRALAASLKEGVPKHKILQNVQAAHINVISPMTLINNQDLLNIAKKHGVSSDFILHQNDAESIHRKYLQLKNAGGNGIFMYKPYGEMSPEYPTLKKDEFVLAYMNHGQEHLLRTQGKAIVCIGSTHGTNAYNFEMTTIMIIDDEFQGFPVDFFFHSSKTQETMLGKLQWVVLTENFYVLGTFIVEFVIETGMPTVSVQVSERDVPGTMKIFRLHYRDGNGKTKWYPMKSGRIQFGFRY